METVRASSSLTAAAVNRILINPNSQTWVSGNRAVPKRKVSHFKLIAGGLLLGAVLSWGGAADEFAATLSPAVPVAPSTVALQWVEVANPLVDVGRRADGSLDEDKMFQAWKAAGLSLEDSMLLIAALQDAPPVLMGRADPVFEQQMRDKQNQLVRAAKASFPNALDRLEKQAGRPFASRRTAPWKKEDWNALKEAWDAYRTDAAVVKIPTLASVEKARSMLEDAVAETGLRALKVSWSDWTTPSRLVWLSENLRQANQDLETVTGWNGPVLGLNGAVVIHMNRPAPQYSANGLSETDDRGVITLTSEWRALGHEWLHAVDYYSGQVLPRSSLGTLLTEQVQKPLRLYHDFKQARSWSRLMGDLEESSPDWFAHKQHVNAFEPAATSSSSTTTVRTSGYWMRPTETLAFAFQAQLSQNPDVKVIGTEMSRLTFDRQSQPYRYPSDEEIQRQKPHWEAFFAANQGLVPSLAERRAARRTVAADAAPAASPSKPSAGR